MKINISQFMFFLISFNWTNAYINKQLSHTFANKFFVKFSSSPFTSSPEHVEAQHSTFHKELKKRGIEVKIGHTFKRYANGIAIETDERHVKRIAEIEHVESVEPVRYYKRFKPDEQFKIKSIKRDNSKMIQIAPNNDINTIHEITGVKNAYEKLGLTGKGVKVGIIDSGIDYRHPALGGCLGPGCRIAYGYNFLNENNDPFDDCNGHGTHVAGIIGGYDIKTGFRGVAPNVIFGAYKILACENNDSADAYNEANNSYGHDEILLMRSIERAIDDGMLIINISAGGPGNARTPSSLMINDVAKHKGIIFMIALGNDGLDGVSTSLEPGVANNAIGVGSFEANKFLNFKAFDTKNPDFVLYYMKMNAAAFPYTKVKVKIFKCINDYKEFNNTILIIDNRDSKVIECSSENKGIIVINAKDDEGLTLSPAVPEYEKLGAILTSKQGDTLIKYLDEHPNLELDFSDKYGYMIEHPFAVTPSIFSGWGLSDEFDIKPDICAPGGFILSVYPINISPYQVLSGTSMSAPYMSGIAALYLETFGKQNSFEQIRAALMNYAIPHKDRNKLLSPVLHQGAGLVNIYDTLRATSFVYPPKINLNDTIHFNGNHTLYIYNVGRKEMEYKLSHLPAPNVNGYNTTLSRSYFQLEYLTNNYADVKFEKDLITVAPGANVKVSVNFTAPKNLSRDKHWFYSGWLKVTPLDNKMPVMSVPYAGLADDARRLPLFQTPKFPKLVEDTTTDNSNIGEIITFTFKNKTGNKLDIPSINLRLATPTHGIFIEILDYNYKFLGVVKIYYGFPAPRVTDLTVDWDGLIYNPNDKNDPGVIAPDGEYFLKIKALKLFGDINNENDYEVWLSPKFIVKRST
ncbi:uncharacterized protein OCT59_003908 [Rhizophagus irregularis]|uniref:Subtilisin-like protein n=1 Tax=Rhizophagus irregularis (strain DAOM 181602 / DAOM 197198 / MUCL 43194) TaxID=747089 RepID=U9UB25_RHIID|nr:hypothetical protein OCT59_003908 [Rhizophagus irregularis]